MPVPLNVEQTMRIDTTVTSTRTQREQIRVYDSRELTSTGTPSRTPGSDGFLLWSHYRERGARPVPLSDLQ